MPDLAHDLHEHLPARLVGMPVLLAAQLAQQRLLKRLEQWCQGKRSANPSIPPEPEAENLAAMYGRARFDADWRPL